MLTAEALAKVKTQVNQIQKLFEGESDPFYPIECSAEVPRVILVLGFAG